MTRATDLPTAADVISRYMDDREKIKAIKKKAQLEVETLEGFQRKREDWLLAQQPTAADFMRMFEFFTDLFVNGRDGKAEKEKEKQDIGLRQEAIERWLLKMLGDDGKGIKTSAGTVYRTRKEGVSVESWDAFLEAEILRPAATELVSSLGIFTGAGENDDRDFEAAVQKVEEILRVAAHLELLTRGVNKSAVLERMGDKDEKTEARPNPPPAGVKYVAVASVGVRKK